MLEMEDIVVVVRPATGDVMNSPITSILELVPFTKTTLCQRFGLQSGDIVEIQKQDSTPRGLAGPSMMSRSDGLEKIWYLWAGSSYNIIAKSDVNDPTWPTILIDKGKSPLVIQPLSDDSEDEDDTQIMDHLLCCPNSSRTPIVELVEEALEDVGTELEDESGFIPTVEKTLESLNADQHIALQPTTDYVSPLYQIFALDALLAISGGSELAKFAQENKFIAQQVATLPSSYNGNVIFELPLGKDTGKKGERLESMDQSTDCYFWTWLVPMTANV